MTKAKAGLSRQGPSGRSRASGRDEVGSSARRGLLPGRAHLLEDPRRVVLDQDVAGLQQATQSRSRSVVSSSVTLCWSVSGRRRSRTAPTSRARRTAARRADGCRRAGRRLDVEDLGTEHRQECVRTGPAERRSGRDPQALERQPPRRSPPRRRRGARTPAVAVPPTGVLAEPGRRRPARGGAAGRTARAGPARQAAARVWDDRARACKWSVRGWCAVADGAWGMRNAAASSRTSAVECAAIQAAISGARCVRLANSDRSSIHSDGRRARRSRATAGRCRRRRRRGRRWWPPRRG